MKSNYIKKTMAALVLSISMLLGAGTPVFATDFSMKDLQPKEADEDWKQVEYQGQQYQYNSNVITVLIMGIDTTSELNEEVPNGNAGQADSIMLVAYDRSTRVFNLIDIPRDTMTEIQTYDMAGNQIGTTVHHINLAYAYGTGGADSCKKMQNAVSDLMYGIPIDYYCAANMNTIGKINDMVGGVTVTVPSDDLEYLGSEFQQGAELTLNEETAETFVRSRNTNESYSNSGRMLRQKVFLEALYKQMVKRVQEDLEGFVSDVIQMGTYLTVNLTISDLKAMLETASEGTVEDYNFHILDGENVSGVNHDEFYADEDSLQQLVMEIFYQVME